MSHYLFSLSLNGALNDVADAAQQKAFVLAPRPRGENHTQQFTLRIGPGDRAGGAAVAEGFLGRQVAECIPRRRCLQSPTQSPRMTEALVLVGRHRLHRGPAENALAVIDSAVERHLQDDAEVIDIAVHAAPRMAELAQVEAVGAVAVEIFLGLGKGIALHARGVRQGALAQTQAAVL